MAAQRFSSSAARVVWEVGWLGGLDVWFCFRPSDHPCIRPSGFVFFEGIKEKDLAPIAQALIKAGADVNIRNKFSKTAKNLSALSPVLYKVL